MLLNIVFLFLINISITSHAIYTTDSRTAVQNDPDYAILVNETITDLTEEDFSVLDICNITRSKRSTDYWLRIPVETTLKERKYKTEVLQNKAEVQKFPRGVQKSDIQNTLYKTEDNSTSTDVPDLYNLSDEFTNCMLSIVEPECYKELENGSVFVPLYNTVFNKSNYLITDNLLLVCPDFFDRFEDFEDKFSSEIAITSIVGIYISTVCIVLHIIMFALVEKMRNLPGYCLLSLCLALLMAYISSIVQFQSSTNCSALGITTYFGFLCSFFWMNVISFDVWQSVLLATTKLRLSSERPVLIRFCLYSLYAWGTPLLIGIASIITDLLSTDEQYKLIFNEDTCWLENKNSLFIYFVLPLSIVLFMNTLFFISSFYMISKSKVAKTTTAGNTKSDLKSRLFLTLKLSTAMGLMWIFGLIATLTQKVWIYYLYSACNTLQGVFIFFSFTVNEKTVKAFKNASRIGKQSVLPSPFPKPSFCNTTVQSTTELDNK